MAIVTKQVVKYETADGSSFDTEQEALAHEFKLENGETIRIAAESFVNTIGAIDRSRNMQLNTISNFLAFYLPWKDAGSVFVERTVEDTPKAEPVVADGETVSDEAVAAAAEVADQAPADDAEPMF